MIKSLLNMIKMTSSHTHLDSTQVWVAIFILNVFTLIWVIASLKRSVRYSQINFEVSIHPNIIVLFFAKCIESLWYRHQYESSSMHEVFIFFPNLFRAPIYKLYSRQFGVNMSEMKEKNLTRYRSLRNFFTRKLEDGARKIHDKLVLTSMCSPVDGTVLSSGHITYEYNRVSNKYEHFVHAVKGNSYPLSEFVLGALAPENETSQFEKLAQAVTQRGNKLMHLVVYLAPGDYHRFHAPTAFKSFYRRHIAGWLESVKPTYIMKNKHVLKDNERVSLLGSWYHGFFSMIFVGALNVGSIVLNFDNELETNQNGKIFAEPKDKAYVEDITVEKSFEAAVPNQSLSSNECGALYDK